MQATHGNKSSYANLTYLFNLTESKSSQAISFPAHMRNCELVVSYEANIVGREWWGRGGVKVGVLVERARWSTDWGSREAAGGAVGDEYLLPHSRQERDYNRGAF